jgi:hypothetical protein
MRPLEREILSYAASHKEAAYDGPTVMEPLLSAVKADLSD